MSQDQKPKGVRVVNGSTAPAQSRGAGQAGTTAAKADTVGAAGATAASAAARAGRVGIAMLGGLFIAGSALGGAAIALLIHP